MQVWYADMSISRQPDLDLASYTTIPLPVIRQSRCRRRFSRSSSLFEAGSGGRRLC